MMQGHLYDNVREKGERGGVTREGGRDDTHVQLIHLTIGGGCFIQGLKWKIRWRGYRLLAMTGSQL